MSMFLLFIIIRQVFYKKRSGTDYAHIAFQDIDRFGKFVERGFSQELAELRQSHGVRQQLSVLISLIRHGAELIELEDLFILTGAILLEQYGTTELYSNQYRYDRIEPTEHDQRQ